MLICKNIPTIINKLRGYCLRLAIMLICKNIPTIINKLPGYCLRLAIC